MLVPRLKRLVSWPFWQIFPQLLIDLPRYEEFWALRNVSVTLARGETLGYHRSEWLWKINVTANYLRNSYADERES